MSRLQLLILWVLVFIAGLAVFSLQKNEQNQLSSDTALQQGDLIVSTEELRTSGGLKFSDSRFTTTLVSKDDTWLVKEQDDYPANLANLGRAFDAVRELKIIQALPAQSQHWDRFGLNSEAKDESTRPRQLSLLNKDGSVSKTIVIGKLREGSGAQQGTSAGRFIRVSGDDSGVYLVQDSFRQLMADSSTWIDKSLPKIDGLLSISVKPQKNPSAAWTVTRPTAVGAFVLDGLEEGFETNPLNVAPLRNIFGSNSFKRIANAEEVAERASVKKGREITLQTASGISYLFTLLPEKKDTPKKSKKDKKKAEKKDDRDYYVSFKVLSGPSDPTPPAEDASDADKASYHALVSNKKISEARYQEHQKLEGRQFFVKNSTLKPLLKSRNEMLRKKESPQAASAPVTVPRNFPGKRLEAVSPPIAIPPRSQNKRKK